jgi:Asp-tRNA(Asn)/Glu-tRNA(Gln) amidotransferase A subunit family amidase
MKSALALVSALGSVLFLCSCSLLPGGSAKLKGDRAFIQYWPPPESQQQKIRLAVKDNIDVKGVVTTAGSEYLDRKAEPAAKDAPCLKIARSRDNVVIVGKTNLSEFAVAPSGFNEYFGTPRNPQDKRWIPGGSSCGAAVAVASGLADVAFGTDTAGSVRVPAAACGVVGLKTTFGLIPIKGVYPISDEYLDTVGPLGRNIHNTAMGMDLLQEGFRGRYAAARAANPKGSGLRVGRLKVRGTESKINDAIDQALARAGFEVVYLGEDVTEAFEQAKKDGNTVAAAGAWLSDRDYAMKPFISGRTKTAILAGRIAYNTGYQEALGRRRGWQRTLQKTFRQVDYIALPTLNTFPPVIPPNLRIGILEAVVLEIQNTVAFNFAGNPALAVPVPLNMEDADKPWTSLQLVGPRLSEAGLLNAGRLVEETSQPEA